MARPFRFFFWDGDSLVLEARFSILDTRYSILEMDLRSSTKHQASSNKHQEPSIVPEAAPYLIPTFAKASSIG